MHYLQSVGKNMFNRRNKNKKQKNDEWNACAEDPNEASPPSDRAVHSASPSVENRMAALIHLVVGISKMPAKGDRTFRSGPKRTQRPPWLKRKYICFSRQDHARKKHGGFAYHPLARG